MRKRFATPVCGTISKNVTWPPQTAKRSRHPLAFQTISLSPTLTKVTSHPHIVKRHAVAHIEEHLVIPSNTANAPSVTLLKVNSPPGTAKSHVVAHFAKGQVTHLHSAKPRCCPRCEVSDHPVAFHKTTLSSTLQKVRAFRHVVQCQRNQILPCTKQDVDTFPFPFTRVGTQRGRRQALGAPESGFGSQGRYFPGRLVSSTTRCRRWPQLCPGKHRSRCQKP